MAFNPFDAFRRNAKPMMAALTIFVMIIFVLSSGGAGADFFDWMARQVGGRDNRSPVVGSIEGTDYRATSLQDLRRRRAAANAFMYDAVANVDQKMMRDTLEDLQKNTIKDPEARTLIEATQIYLGNMQQMVQMPRQLAAQYIPIIARGNERAARILEPLVGVQPDQAIQQLSFTLGDYMSRTKESEKAAEFQALRRLTRILNNQLRRMLMGGERFYFDLPNKTEEDALRFEMYLRLAEKMDIHYVDADIERLIAHETDSMLPADVRSMLFAQIQRSFQGMTIDKVLDAIGDEFRVRTALKVVGGGVYSGKDSTPFALTPFEFYEFFKDRMTEVTFEVVDVPVESFLDQVTEKPTEKELDKFFREHKSIEYDPASEKPGFKEPRKVKLEYIAIDANLPMYKGALPYLQAVSEIAGGFSGTFVGVGPVPGVLQAAAPFLNEPLSVVENRRAIEEMVKQPRGFAWTSHGFGPKPPPAQLLLDLKDVLFGNQFYDVIGIGAIAEAARQFLPVNEPLRIAPRDSSIYDPLAITSFIGSLVVPVSPAVNANAAMWSSRTAAEFIDIRDRVAFGMQLTIAPMSPAFFLAGNPAALLGPAVANLPPEPVGVYLAQFAADRGRRRLEEIASKDFNALTDKLSDLHKNLEVEGAPKDGKSAPKLDQAKLDRANIESRAYVDQWIKNHPGVITGKSGLDDRFHLADDPALDAALEDLKKEPNYERAIQGLFFNPNDTNGEANKFRPLVPSDFRRQQGGGRDFSKPLYALWKIDDREAKEYQSYEQTSPEMREKIVKAWKMQKARVLAQEAADRFAKTAGELATKELKQASSPQAFKNGLADAAAAAKLRLLPSPLKLAKLKKQPTFRMTGQPPYAEASIDNKDIVLPLGRGGFGGRNGDVMADMLVEARDKPLGETMVIPNKPKDHFYVAVLAAKQEPNVEAFNDVFSKTNVPPAEAREQDILYRIALDEQARKFRTDVSERVKAEMRYKETEEMKKIDRRDETEQ